MTTVPRGGKRSEGGERTEERRCPVEVTNRYHNIVVDYNSTMLRGAGGDRAGMWYTSAPDEARARLDIKSRQSKWKDRERCVYACVGVCAEFVCVWNVGGR